MAVITGDRRLAAFPGWIAPAERPQPRQHSQSVLGMLIEPCRSVATQSSRRIVI
jgi:hypothetical protein